jgi:hypothetical protein
MATNPKPLRLMEKRFFRGHPREQKESLQEVNFNSPLHNYILVKKKPTKVKFSTWVVWFELASRDRRRILKSTQVDKDIRVSTVFLGVATNELFETMIFGGQHEGYQERYYTYEEALAGHQRACELAFEVPQ